MPGPYRQSKLRRKKISKDPIDFRSLYLHYECACLIFENDVLKDITEDFHRTFADSHRITMSDYKKMNLMKRFAGRVLRVFAPQV